VKVRMALVFSVVLVIAGLVPLLYFAALGIAQVAISVQAGSWVPLPLTLLFADHSVVQGSKAAPLLAYIPELRWEGHQVIAWILDRIHVGVVFAVIGLAVIPHGVSGISRRRAVIRAEKLAEEDRLRRTRDYRRDEDLPDVLEGRREPFIGSRRSAASRS